MRPLFVAGTSQHIGKTTTSLGLLHAFRNRGLNVGYCKPLGQRFAGKGKHTLHEDTLLITRSLGMSEDQQPDLAVPLSSGKVGEAIQDLQVEKYLDGIRQTFDAVAEGRDLTVVEGAGHVAVGSCLKVSTAEVACTVDAKVLLISSGGVGSTIDSLSLSWDFLRYRGADVMGVLVNKIWPQKYTRIKDTVTRGLANLDIPCFGAVPFEERLSQPTMRQVHEAIGGELIAGADQLDNRVENTIVAAMEAEHMIHYLKCSTLIFTPGDRSDNLLAALSAATLGDVCEAPIAGLILTGGFTPNSTILRMIEAAHVPTILIEGDTYSTASKFHATAFKIAVEDNEKIQWAMCLAEEHIDIDGLIEQLED
ncbi:MAG: phosphotransacetylase family protein [Planctomycetota bacterium]|jgi:BioD-like phosphotransacetylase family protein